jgi:hypothetical protein
MVVAEVFAAWEKSRQQKVTKTKRWIEGDDGITQIEERIEDQSGDTKLIDKVLECMDRKSKLLEIHKPANNGPGADGLDNMSDGELATLARTLADEIDMNRAVEGSAEKKDELDTA